MIRFYRRHAPADDDATFFSDTPRCRFAAFAAAESSLLRSLRARHFLPCFLFQAVELPVRLRQMT
jgi:hypothetical protein